MNSSAPDEPSFFSRWLVEPLQRAVGDAVQVLGDVAGLDTVRLAVSGLSRSGKTVFVTALARNLLEARTRPELLPFFGLAADTRLLDVAVEPIDDGPSFPLAEKSAHILREGVWPPSTRDISRLRLAIRYRPGNLLARSLAREGRVVLEITDYPGEWLLDLPLLDLDFAQWSRATLALAEQGDRAALSAEWRALCSVLDPELLAGPATIDAGFDAYARYCATCRAPPHRFSVVQPGRFVTPGPADPRVRELGFFPCLRKADAPPPEGSLFAELGRRFELYKERIVRPFYTDHFRRFDRQIVLVDVLTALNTGPDCFVDMCAALRTVLGHFRYGSNHPLFRLFGPRIGTAIFAATKCDHVTPNQFHNLRLLLRAMAGERTDAIEREGADVRFMALAAVKCTTTAVATIDGHRLSVVRGRLSGRDHPVQLFPGEVPATMPTPGAWPEGAFAFHDFAPPRQLPPGRSWFGHVNLDQCLDDLLRERLR